MMTSSRMRAAQSFEEAVARDMRTDTIPAPPPSSSRKPTVDDAAPTSRLLPSETTQSVRKDTIPAPPPTDEDIEAAPSTERMLPDAG